MSVLPSPERERVRGSGRSQRSKSRPSIRRRALTFARDVVIIIVVAVLISFLIKTFVVRSYYIPSGSMENTLRVDDLIVVNELVPTVVPIHRGDVVVFKDPGGWLPASAKDGVAANPVMQALTDVGLAAPKTSDDLVKRVIGLPGDRVSCCNGLGQLVVNGSPLEEPYIALNDPLPGEADAAAVHFDVVVPRGDLWVMGDNRYNSKDSSLNRGLPGHGFVPQSDVVGRAVLVSWPIDHWAWLSDYASVFAGVQPNTGG